VPLVPIELPNVFERILIAPDAPAWLAALVRRVTDHYQFNSIPVLLQRWEMRHFTNKMTTLICFALKEEAAHFRKSRAA